MKIYPIMYTETFEITSAGGGQGVKYVRDCTGTSSSRYRRCGRHLATAGHRPVTGQQYAYDRNHAEGGLGPRLPPAECVCRMSRQGARPDYRYYPEADKASAEPALL